jgi:hypothetical protein
MRLARLVLAGLVAGALLGFLVGLVRPRPRGVLPGLAVPTEGVDPVVDAGEGSGR